MYSTTIIHVAIAVLISQVHTLPKHPKDKHGLHYRMDSTTKVGSDVNPAEKTADYWINNARNVLKEKFATKSNRNVAKNVILFLGDGMSIPTLAATRAYLGGEETSLSFEKFPHTALSKTYCVDYQVADSACTSTAYLSGVKANMGTLGVIGKVGWEDCDAMADTNNHVFSIAKWSQLKGKKTGLVSTASVTDASPAGVYAHTAERDWQSDTDIIKAGLDVNKCRDIAYQLINNEEGKNLNVILGGGRKEFLPSTVTDEQANKGDRTNDTNLIDQWLNEKKQDNKNAEYVWNRDQLLAISEDSEYVLGLFAPENLPYNLDRNKTVVPSLLEMTETAINILSKNNPNGYFLFVEGAEIDDALHETRSKKALDETVEFSKAIERAVELTSEADTLIVVTSDHSHTLSYSGYALRHNDILGSPGEDEDGMQFLALNSANGPGYKRNYENGSRYDVGQDDTDDKDYQFPTVFPLDSATHGGEDVAIFARGPWAELYSGVLEQTVIAHIMAYASCVGDGDTACTRAADNAAESVVARWGLTFAIAVFVAVFRM